jgi:hypothetical protein
LPASYQSLVEEPLVEEPLVDGSAACGADDGGAVPDAFASVAVRDAGPVETEKPAVPRRSTHAARAAASKDHTAGLEEETGATIGTENGKRRSVHR